MATTSGFSMRWFRRRTPRDVDELQRRVLDAVRKGDLPRILDEGAERCAARVRVGLRADADPMHNLGAVFALASWHWHRRTYFEVMADLTGDEGAQRLREAELVMALDHFRAVRWTAPGLIPDEVVPELDRHLGEEPSAAALDLLGLLQPAGGIVADLKARPPVKARPAKVPQTKIPRASYPRDVRKVLTEAAEIVERLDDGEHDLVDDAADRLERAYVMLPPGHVQRPAVANLLAAVLVRRGSMRRSAPDLDAAVDLAAIAAATGSPTFVATLAEALHRRYVVGGELDDLDRAIEAQRELVAADRADTGRIFELAGMLHSRLEHASDPADLEEAEELAGLLADRTTGGEQAEALILLGLLAFYRYETTSERRHLDNALARHREALAVSEPQLRVVPLVDLALCLRSLYELTGDAAAQIEAVELSREAVALPHDGDLAVELNLAHTLFVEHDRTGMIEPLDEAIQLARSVLDQSPETAVDWADIAGALAVFLQRRYRLTDQGELLESAETWLRRAVAVAQSERRPGLLSALAAVLSDRPGRGDTEEAARLFRQALDECPPDGVFRATLLMNLASALISLGQHGEAEAVAREGLALTPEDALGRATAADTLAIALQGLGDPAALDEAVALGEEAIAASWPGHSADASIRLNQAIRLDLREGPGDLPAAFALWREAADDPTASTYARLDAARAWADAAARRALGGTEAVEAYSACMELLPRRLWRGLPRTDAEALLAQLPGLTRDAAANALEAGMPERALEYLEQGRGMLWTRLVEGRTDLADLAAAEPDLAARFTELHAALDTMPADEPLGPDRRVELARELDELIELIRRIPGQSRFLRPTDVGSLRGMDDEGPVVLLNVSRWRCDALIVEPGEIRSVRLTGLDDGEATRWAGDHLDAMAALDAAASDPLAVIRAERELTVLLRRLAETVTGPVLESFPEPPRRIWWCPTGPLTMLPLHAASGDAVCSVLPSLRALTQARQAAPVPRDRLLLVAVPDAPGAEPLPGVDAEQAFLTRTFPDCTLFRNAERIPVREALARHGRVHFSCHASQNLVAPSEAGFLLQDGLLSLTDLLSTAPASGEIAVLSACKTAAGGGAHLDEAITLANALHHNGWRHVVATQFSVWDDASAEFTELFYPLLEECTDPAKAVHAAVRKLRAAYPNSPSRWAPFLHTGP